MRKKSKHLGELLTELADASDFTQSEIARSLGSPVSQVNRFFRGHNDIYASHLVRICKILGIDLEKLIIQRIRKLRGVDDAEVETMQDCVQYLFNELDELGRQTYLNNLMWAAKVSKQKDIPKRIEEIVRKKTSLI